MYKAGDGAPHAALLADNKAALRARKSELKALAGRINAAKRDMDSVKATAAAANAAAKAAGTAADAAAEAEWTTQLRGLKRDYKAAYDEMRGVQSDADYTAQLVEAATRQLVDAFAAWCAHSFRLLACLLASK